MQTIQHPFLAPVIHRRPIAEIFRATARQTVTFCVRRGVTANSVSQRPWSWAWSVGWRWSVSVGS